MTDASPTLFAPPTKPRAWRIQLADGSERVVTAGACRVECACLLFTENSGLVVALSPGQWLAVEMVQP